MQTQKQKLTQNKILKELIDEILAGYFDVGDQVVHAFDQLGDRQILQYLFAHLDYFSHFGFIESEQYGGDTLQDSSLANY